MTAPGILSAGMLAAGVVLLAGCSGSDAQTADAPDASPAATQESDRSTGIQADLEVTYDGTGCTYSGPSEVDPGVVGIEVVNTSEVGSGALLLRLAADATFDDVIAAHQPEPYLGEPLDIGEPSGAVTRVVPGQTGSSTFPVQAGDYVLLCLVDSDDPDDPASYLAQPVGVTVSG